MHKSKVDEIQYVDEMMSKAGQRHEVTVARLLEANQGD